jgi:5-methylcytosine-specific restriction endonuclease McrA
MERVPRRSAELRRRWATRPLRGSAPIVCVNPAGASAPNGDSGPPKVMASRPELDKAAWQRVRKAVRRRDGDQCKNCGANGDGVRLSVHHLRPAVLGGTDDMSNLLTLCSTCHPIYEQTARTLTLPVDPPPPRKRTARRDSHSPRVSRCWCGTPKPDCGKVHYCRKRFPVS